MSQADPFISSVKVVIDAPAELVWSILVDLPKYSEWNPFTPEVRSTLKLGEPVELTVPHPLDPKQKLQVTEYLCAFEPPTRLAWEIPGYSLREQYVEALGPRRCSYYTTDRWFNEGVKDFLAHGQYVKEGFDSVAHSLKRRAEALYAGD